ncbi:MAG: MMPL family transporter, partial [Gammaproteobacteria bacterium]
MGKAYGEWLARWRYPVLFLSIVLAAVAASGIRFIYFDADYRVFFGADNPELQAFENLQNTYTKTDNVLFILAPRGGSVFTPETLAAVISLTEGAWQIPYSIRVDSISNYQHTEAEGDDLIVEDLVPDAAGLGPAQLQRIRAVALSEPTLVNRLVSPSGHVTGVNVTIQLPDLAEQTGLEVADVIGYARGLVTELRAGNPDLEVYLTGMAVMNNTFPEVSLHDQRTLVPLMLAVVLMTLLLLLRSFSAIAGTFLVIALSVLTAMGLAGWLGIGLTPPSAQSPTIILTLAVADCVHILISFLHAM